MFLEDFEHDRMIQKLVDNTCFPLFVYAIVWQQLLKKLPLVTAYANKAVTVIWGIVWGYFFFNEGITIYKLIGAVVIVIGVYLVVSSDGESNVLDNILEEEK